MGSRETPLSGSLPTRSSRGESDRNAAVSGWRSGWAPEGLCGFEPFHFFQVSGFAGGY